MSPSFQIPAVIVTAAVLVTAAASPAGAQEAATSRAARGPEVSLSGAVMTPLSPLTRSDVSFDTEVSSSAAVTGALTWWVGRHLGVSGRGTWAPAKLNLRGAPLGAAAPDDLGDADYLAGLVEVNYRFLPGGAASMLKPFVSLGGGVRDLSLDPVAGPEARSATDPVATAAGGIHVRAWGDLSLRVELRDLVSSYDSGETGESRIQHDVFVSVGLSLRP